MPHEEHVLHIAADSDLGRLLDQAVERTVVLERAGRRYRVVPDPDLLWAGYDPARIQRALQAHAGMWSVEDAARLQAASYAAREAGSRPASRP